MLCEIVKVVAAKPARNNLGLSYRAATFDTNDLSCKVFTESRLQPSQWSNDLSGHFVVYKLWY